MLVLRVRAPGEERERTVAHEVGSNCFTDRARIAGEAVPLATQRAAAVGSHDHRPGGKLAACEARESAEWKITGTAEAARDGALDETRRRGTGVVDRLQKRDRLTVHGARCHTERALPRSRHEIPRVELGDEQAVERDAETRDACRSEE